MATRLKGLRLTSVDLVKAGANQQADICIYKSVEGEKDATKEKKPIYPDMPPGRTVKKTSKSRFDCVVELSGEPFFHGSVR